MLLKDEEVKGPVDVGTVPVGAILEEFPAGYGMVLDGVMGLDDVAEEAELMIIRAVPDGAPVPVVGIFDVELSRG